MLKKLLIKDNVLLIHLVAIAFTSGTAIIYYLNSEIKTAMFQTLILGVTIGSLLHWRATQRALKDNFYLTKIIGHYHEMLLVAEPEDLELLKKSLIELHKKHIEQQKSNKK